MRTSADERSFYKMVIATTAEDQGQSKEQHEGVSRPCIRTKSQRERRWKPRKKLHSQVKNATKVG